jgi:hypothetical protein
MKPEILVFVTLKNNFSRFDNRHICQLRRLGARGGAGKPTLLSLKN